MPHKYFELCQLHMYNIYPKIEERKYLYKCRSPTSIYLETPGQMIRTQYSLEISQKPNEDQKETGGIVAHKVDSECIVIQPIKEASSTYKTLVVLYNLS